MSLQRPTRTTSGPLLTYSMDDDGIDSVYISMVTPFFVDNSSIVRQIVEVSKQKRKPIVWTLMTDKIGCAETVQIMKKGGVPCYDFRPQQRECWFR